jgi:hypothetical protein
MRSVGREPVWFENVDPEKARADRELVVRDDLSPPVPEQQMNDLLEQLEEALGDRRPGRLTEPDSLSDEPTSPSEIVIPSVPGPPADDRPPALERGTAELSSPAPGPRSRRRRKKKA